MASPVVHGPAYSTYVRSARLALVEKGVDYELREFDFLKGMPDEQLHRHPFGKVPAFEHDGFSLYETAAIERYVDERFAGPRLQPEDPAGRARMTQVVCVLDSYTYGPMVGTVVIQRLVMPMMGAAPNEKRIEDALPAVRRAVGVLDRFAAGGRFLAGDSLTLADLHLIPMYDYFRMTPDAQPVLEAAPNLRRWWDSISSRASVAATAPKLG